MSKLHKPIENKELTDFLKKNNPKDKPRFTGNVSCNNYANCRNVIKKYDH